MLKIRQLSHLKKTVLNFLERDRQIRFWSDSTVIPSNVVKGRKTKAKVTLMFTAASTIGFVGYGLQSGADLNSKKSHNE